MLRNRWGKDTSSIRIMYETEVTQATNVITQTSKDKEALEGEIKKLQEQINEFRRK